jgi:hypothetical protein
MWGRWTAEDGTKYRLTSNGTAERVGGWREQLWRGTKVLAIALGLLFLATAAIAQSILDALGS